MISFLKKEAPDVICLQEVLGSDVDYLKKSLGVKGLYAPSAYFIDSNWAAPGSTDVWGILTLTRLDISNIFTNYYFGSQDNLPTLMSLTSNPAAINRILLVVEINVGNIPFRIINTHFTWSADGQATDLQRQHFPKMLNMLGDYDGFVLCGDFNAPRGREIWTSLAEKFTDNVSASIDSTIDPHLHKVNGLHIVVDGVFSTSQYVVTDLVLHSGISDHQAIVCQVSKN